MSNRIASIFGKKPAQTIDKIAMIKIGNFNFDAYSDEIIICRTPFCTIQRLAYFNQETWLGLAKSLVNQGS